MDTTCNWSIRNNADLRKIVTITEDPQKVDVNNYIIADKSNCSDPCEVTVAFNTAVRLSSIQWTSAARICEVYVVEHDKAKPSYLGTKRCVLMDEKITVDTNQIQMYKGEADFPENSLVDSIKVRFLSIKEKIFAIVRSIACIGKQTIIDLKQPVPPEDHPERLIVPKPIKPEDSLSSALQTAFAQQVLFEGKMKSLEERLGLQMERLVTALTITQANNFEEIKRRLDMMEERIDNIDNRVKELESKIEK